MLRVLPILFLAAGCDSALAIQMPERPPATAIVANDRFDPAATGTLTGTLIWSGERPRIDPVQVFGFRIGAPATVRTIPHPNAPAISNSGGVAGTLIRLSGIDLRRAKSMQPEELSVELGEDRLAIIREGTRHRTAWTPVGSTLRLTNRNSGIGGIRARGSSFFTHMIPEPDSSVTRVLGQTGPTTFTSASGQQWAVADLYVSEHPYVAITDGLGRFQMEQVPDGEYELIAWHPNWHVSGHELDPETGVVARQSFANPVEVRIPIRVAAGSKQDVKLAFTTADFKP